MCSTWILLQGLADGRSSTALIVGVLVALWILGLGALLIHIARLRAPNVHDDVNDETGDGFATNAPTNRAPLSSAPVVVDGVAISSYPATSRPAASPDPATLATTARSIPISARSC